ncbi:hypothetical protein Pan216_45550 [Planctomycetes bacterium Pan216]|uniref:DUF58 domain-containing protein n=1 Tax=Kolteria novifilia TaxID=2527975 RepID=A0A518B9L8_9BACT|nr:hypothetical protein Pan216_45550 [Planctomycetes bacterium Pan216]
MSTRRFFRWTTRPTKQGMVFLFILACVFGASFIQRVNLLVLIFSLSSALLGVGLWVQDRMLRGVKLRRTAPRQVEAGDGFNVTLEASKEFGPAIWATCVVESLEPRVPTFAPEAPLPVVREGDSGKGNYRARLPKRGRYRFASPWLVTQFPFGFFERRRAPVAVEGDLEITVTPRMGTILRPFWPMATSGAESPRLSAAVQSRQFEELAGLRPYRTGDNPRHIHWRTTARRGETIIKEFHRAGGVEGLLVVEAWRPARTRDVADQTVERLLSFAATFLRDRCRQTSAQMTVLLVGETTRLHTGIASQGLLAVCLEDLAVMQASPDADWSRSARETLGQAMFQGGTLLASTRPQPEATAALSAYVTRGMAGSPLVVDVSEESFGETFTMEAP